LLNVFLLSFLINNDRMKLFILIILICLIV
jgi:hypothetical protein